ncbi:MAG: hypothetical protein HY794_06995 [Desulfarculus sp.]|nr:hypothetical protein [Desulfarculus sp.]
MPSTPAQGHPGPAAPTAAAAAWAEASPPPPEMASHTRGRIQRQSGQALRAQANSLPGLACHLLAGSQGGN